MQQDVPEREAGPKEPSQTSSLPHQIKIPSEFAKQIDSLSSCHKTHGMFCITTSNGGRKQTLKLGPSQDPRARGGAASCKRWSRLVSAASAAVPAPSVPKVTTTSLLSRRGHLLQPQQPQTDPQECSVLDSPSLLRLTADG